MTRLVGNLNEDALAEYVKFCEKALLGDQEGMCGNPRSDGSEFISDKQRMS